MGGVSDPFRDGDHQEALNQPLQRERDLYARRARFIRWGGPPALFLSFLSVSYAVHLWVTPPDPFARHPQPFLIFVLPAVVQIIALITTWRVRAAAIAIRRLRVLLSAAITLTVIAIVMLLLADFNCSLTRGYFGAMSAH
jgi:hypothetical protein